MKSAGIQTLAHSRIIDSTSTFYSKRCGNTNLCTFKQIWEYTYILLFMLAGIQTFARSSIFGNTPIFSSKGWREYKPLHVQAYSGIQLYTTVNAGGNTNLCTFKRIWEYTYIL
jgi:hypothetical protein